MVANESKTIPHVPLINPVKYYTVMITPTDVLLIRSMLPIFFVKLSSFYVLNRTLTDVFCKNSFSSVVAESLNLKFY